MQFKRAEQFILKKLRNDLPTHLSYHTIDHVIDVYKAAGRIGKQEKITVYEMKLLLTAACYHDAGFLNSANRHEEVSCDIVKRTLPSFGYTPDEVDKVCGLIMATRLPQTPKNHLEEILADADLDYLGRDDFFSTGNKLFVELSEAGSLKSELEWNQLQVRFLEDHHYFTKTALESRQEKKTKHLDELKAKLKQ